MSKSDDDDNQSIADVLRETMDEQEDSDIEPTSTPKEDDAPLSKETSERERDEAGKFVSKEKESSVIEPTIDDRTIQLDVNKAPSTWTPAARELWAGLPEGAKAEIIKRESESANGVRQLQDRMAQSDQMLQALNPFLQEAYQATGNDPVQHFADLMQTERVLRSAPMADKFAMWLRVADQYQIPVRQIINQSVGQEVLKNPQNDQTKFNEQIQQRLDAYERSMAQQEQVNINHSVEGWGDGKEFFSDVRGIMADLVENGMVNGIDEAYDKACYLHEGVRSVLMKRAGSHVSQSTITEKQRKASSASTPNRNKVEIDYDEDEDDDSISGILKSEMKKAVTGRI